ncbi:hypothetical protein PP485_gp34 [Gordonia phage ThankyouJordi]|uniref:Transmembrane protein n=1 Tax=Gordonia phage ThankyouJordi TaxID=2571252 RepID=A0A4Y6EIG8_9CAUD|nr:hypothetical protein PP485_gp34 [Gordonia phage ThankyouJordi]QCW22219.1 membrane protein [Gordonia phage WelcomeAyanna]QDF17795.1 hypothetical protein SEA_THANKYOUJORDI_34 [Gordonia phage ThankyouJordi]
MKDDDEPGDEEINEEIRRRADLMAFFDATIDDLDQDDPSDATDDKSIKERMDDERLGELTDARTYRRRIVLFTLIIVGGLVTAATAFMGIYIGSEWHEIKESVIIAYFTSVVVESIGILYVITQYLFPKSGAQHERSEDDGTPD